MSKLSLEDTVRSNQIMGKRERKNIFIYPVYLNPGVIFGILVLATVIFIIGYKSSDEVVDIKIPDNMTSESFTGKNTINTTDKMKEEGNNLSTSVRFEDVTLESGIEFYHRQGGTMLNAISEVVGSGACMGDYDNDGFVDIYAVNGSGYINFYGKKWWWYKDPYNTLYHNNGDGTFTDVTEKAGVGYKGWGMGCAWGDYDNDGNLDLYVTNHGANVLYHNNGGGTFTDVTEKAGVGDKGWGMGCAWGDYNNDGYLDIYIANYLEFDKTMNPAEPNSAFKIETPLLMDSRLYDSQRNVLYRNKGDGTFTDVTDKAGVGNSPGKSMGVVFLDFNEDGYQDIYVVNDNSRNVLYVNNGTGTFTDVGGTLGVDSPLSGMGVTVGDYDNDGDFDIFSTYTQKDTNMLYKNTRMDSGKKTKDYSLSKFVDVTVDAGLGEDVSVGYFGWGTEFLDYDNDGYLDIFVANGHPMVDFDDPKSTIGQRNQLFKNHGDGSFLEVSGNAGEGLMPYTTSRGVTIGDYDNDGDVDVFVLNNNAYATLLQNVGGNTHNWLTIKLRGTKSNRDAIGAKIKVVAGQLSQTREVRSGSSYLSQSDMRLHFGLSTLSKVDMIEIRWPSGITERLQDIKANQFIEIIEGEGSFRVIDSAKKTDARLSETRNSEIDSKIVINSEVRQQALIALGNLRDERAMKPLLLCLKDKDAGVRKVSVSALRYFNNDRFLEPIIMALEDDDRGVRREAAATLGYLLKVEQTITKASMQRKRLAVPPLLKSLKDTDPRVRQEAVKALGFSESYRACIPVTKMLDDTDKEVRREAAVVLGLLRDKRAISALLDVLKNDEEYSDIRAGAVISLSRLESEIITEPLIEALKDEDGEKRRKAASVFVAVFENEEGIVFKKDQSIKPLTDAMNDNDPMVRREVIKAMGFIKDRRINNHLIQALTDKDEGVKQMAVKVLNSSENNEALPSSADVLKDKNHEVRKEVELTVAGLPDNKSLPYLVNTVNDGKIGKYATMCLSGVKDKKAIESLINKVTDKDKEVRRGAVLALGGVKDDMVFAVLLRVFMDRNEDERVRASAVSSLSCLGNKKALTSMLKVLKNRGDSVTVRLEVVKAFGVFKDEWAFKHLRMLIMDKNENISIRSQAIVTMSQMDSKKAVEVLIDIALPFAHKTTLNSP